MRFIISIVVTVALINITDGRVYNNFTKKKRQSFLCVSTYALLSTQEPQCGLPQSFDSGIPSFSVGLFEKLCSSETCINVVKTLLRVCTSDAIESQLPTEYQNVDAESFFDLFCTKVSDGTHCYNKLPLFNDSNTDPVTSCLSVLNGATCSSSCHQGLLHYTSTCCFATYLELLPNQYNIQPTNLWGRCNIVTPQTCNISINDTTAGTPVSTDGPPNTGSPANTGGPGNNDGTSNTATSHPGTSGGDDNRNDVSSSTSHSDDKESRTIGISVSVGMVIMILVVAVPATLIILFLYFKRKRGLRLSTAGSGDVMRMSLANNEDPDD